MTERKQRTGYEKSVDGFSVPHLFVHRASNAHYDVYAHVKEGRQSLFSDNKTYQNRIFTGLATRKEAVRVARLARDVLLATVAIQIADWEAGRSPMP